jgi:glycerophosphoryl diester phosphodiesterase
MRPVVVAHRTCPLQAADNSVEGILQAHRLGADAVEVDVRVTRDGVPVLVHDRTLWRVARLPVPVELLSARRVRSLRRRGAGGELVTLSDALAALPAGLTMAIDIKRGGAALATVRAVQAAGAQRRVWFWSKRRSALRRCRAALPGVERTLLRDARTRWGVGRLLVDAERLGATGISAHWSTVTPALADAARTKGLRLFAMARHVETQSAKLAMLDGVVTDWPAEALDAALSRGRQEPRQGRPN